MGLDVPALRAMADPVRLRMLLLMQGTPRTVKELAAALRAPATRLYYHVKILEDAGLIDVAQTRIVSGIQERRYRAVPKDLSVEPSTLASSAVHATGIVQAIFGAVGAEIQLALEDDPDGLVGDPRGPLPTLSMAPVALSSGDVVRFLDRIAEVVDEFDAGEGPPPPGKRVFRSLFAVFPMPTGAG